MRPLSWHAIDSKRVRRCAAPPPGETPYQLFHIKQLGYPVTGTGNLYLKSSSGIDWPSPTDGNAPHLTLFLQDNLSHNGVTHLTQASHTLLDSHGQRALSGNTDHCRRTICRYLSSAPFKVYEDPTLCNRPQCQCKDMLDGIRHL